MKLKVHIDGSWSSNSPDIVGWAFYANDGTKKAGKLTGEISSMHQIGGELKAAMEAIKYAIAAGSKEVVLLYDYVGLKHWAEMSWKRKNNFTKSYAEWVNTMIQKHGIKITWVKVSGSRNLADSLARKITGAKDRH